jgi:hypothetical protein
MVSRGGKASPALTSTGAIAGCRGNWTAAVTEADSQAGD